MAEKEVKVVRRKTKRIFDMGAYDRDVEKGMDPKKAKEKQIKIMNK